MKKPCQFEKCATIGPDAVNSAKQSRWSVMRLIEIALLTVGIALAGFFVAAHLETIIVSREALKAFEEAAPSPIQSAAEMSPEANATEPDFRDWDAQRVRAYERTARNSTVVPLAILEIPKIGLTAPVLEGTSALTLNHAVGRISGTAYPGEQGNIGLAAHRDGFFRGLKGIKPGDMIELRTHNGDDIYTVNRLQIVTPRDVDVLLPQPEPSLTLVTCYPFYYIGSAPKRFVVTAYLTQHATAAPTTSESRPITQTHNTTQEEQ
ncbi:MAG: class D sortase [Terriglobia bacterium]